MFDADEVPACIPRRRAFLVATPATQKWLVFDCPCGAGHRIMLNLDGTRKPFWRLKTSVRRKITLSPSIDYRDKNRRCHYFMKKGRVRWSEQHP